MKLRFSVRDLLWLTLVVGLGLGWFVRERALRFEVAAWQARCEQMEKIVIPYLEAVERTHKIMQELQEKRELDEKLLPSPERP